MISTSEIDSQVASGNVQRNLYRHMTEAEEYGAASSLPWLQSIIIRLQAQVSLYGRIEVDSEHGLIEINSLNEFNDFIEREFPAAYKLCCSANR